MGSGTKTAFTVSVISVDPSLSRPFAAILQTPSFSPQGFPGAVDRSSAFGFPANQADMYFGPGEAAAQMNGLVVLIEIMALAMMVAQRMAGTGRSFSGMGNPSEGSSNTGPFDSSRRVQSWCGGGDPNPVTPDPTNTPGGAVTFRAGMAIDGDGSFDPRARNDPDWQPQTSLKWNGQSADASQVPYVVMSPSAARSV